MTAARPPLSVVIVTRDRPEMLDRALSAVRRALGADDELLVVDSASRQPDPVAAVVATHGGRLVRLDRPGETVARNAGWRAARFDLVAYTDDDVWVDKGWADALAQCCAEHPEASFVTGRIDIPDGQGTLAVSIKDSSEPEVFDRQTVTMIGHAASLAVRKSALAEVGGFDELLGAGARFQGAPEVDLFDRLFARGHTGRYEPTARAWHDQWRRIREYLRIQYRYGGGSGARMSKLARSDRKRLRAAVVTDVWKWGIVPIPGELVHRDWFRSLGSLLRIAGMLRGFVVGLTIPVRDGHFRPRR